MTIATTVAALQALHATVTGITSAPTTTPASIDTAGLPLVLTIPGAATWRKESFTTKEQERQYIVRVFVEPVGQGTVAQNMAAALPIMQAMGAAYLAAPTLSGAVFNTEFTDSGLDGRLMLAGVEYVGFELRITVWEPV